jgi:aminoglycoside phosphotransferase (APT) family kinase protein
MVDDIHNRCAALLAELSLARCEEVTSVTPLTGGVASDIARVEVGETTYVAKFALPKLKVAADWRAPVHRNAAEYSWLQVAAEVSPEAAVQLFGRSASAHGFAMEYLAGDGVYLWKSALLAQKPPKDEAAQVGDLLGRIHAASAALGFDSSPFHNRDDFRALRIEPYLTFTAGRHPEVSDRLTGLAETLYGSQQILVHGDVSPKNILFRPAGPVLLDAECATMGDASFDPAFCLNHLVLKAIHLPAQRNALLAQVQGFWAAYQTHITWEAAPQLQARICDLLPALMLGRVDGKSPVEYLSASEQEAVRVITTSLIRQPTTSLEDLTGRVAQMLKEQDH